MKQITISIVILILIIGITLTPACKKQETKELVTSADTKVVDWTPVDYSIMPNFDPNHTQRMWLKEDSYSYLSGSNLKDPEKYKEGEWFDVTVKSDKAYFAGKDMDGDVDAERYFFAKDLSPTPSTKE